MINIAKNILFLWLIPLISSCSFQQGFSPSQHLISKPIATQQGFELHHLPKGYDQKKVLNEATKTAMAVQKWLNGTTTPLPVRILVFSPKSDTGQSLLINEKHTVKSTGFYHYDDNLIVVVGEANDPRLWTVLRHEVVHRVIAESHASIPPPFWLNEGIAMLFELGIDQSGLPIVSQERRKLARYLINHGNGLNWNRLISHPKIAIPNGKDYARAWSLVSALYNEKRPLRLFLQTKKDVVRSPSDNFKHYLLDKGESIKSFEEKHMNILKIDNFQH